MDHSDLIQTVRELKDTLSINVEEASPGDFIPLPSGYENRHTFVERFGMLDVLHFDLYSTALSKIERGRMQDFEDVLALLRAGQIARITRRLVLILIALVTTISYSQTSNLDDVAILSHMRSLVRRDSALQIQACKALEKNKNLGVVPALVEVMRFAKLPAACERTLVRLTGKNFSDDWPAWMEWLGRQEFEPHPAYAQFKQELFGSIDPDFARFLNPPAPRTIRLDEIVWGGVKKDGIPALDNPKMLKADEAKYLDDDDDIFGVAIDGEHHAYPLRILNWHEMLNTVIGGKPVTLTYCTLCGAAVLYDPTFAGTTYMFGSSGLLYRSNKLMYDRQTQSLWSSLYGEPVMGELVGKGIKLERLYVVRTSWKAWWQLHPETLVLDVQTGFGRDYRPGAAYKEYFESSDTMFPVAWRDKRLKAKDWIYGVIAGDSAKAYPLKHLKKSPVVNDRFAGGNLVLVADAEQLTVRVYQRRRIIFVKQITPEILQDKNGEAWRITEAALENQRDGSRLLRRSGHLAYWFGWYAFFPKTAVWKKE